MAIELNALLWAIVTLAIFTVPMLPSWREFKTASDALPLAVEPMSLGQDADDAQAPFDPLSAQVTVVEGQLSGSVLRAESVLCNAETHLPPSVEASAFIQLAAGCTFTRLRAPLIGPKAEDGPAATAPVTARIGRKTRAQYLGSLRLEAGMVLKRDCVVRGDLVLESNADLRGDVKVHGRVLLSAGASVHGHLFAHKSVLLEECAFVEGHLVSLERVRMNALSQVGTLEAPASLSAPYLSVQASARVHGSAHASCSGKVFA